jgi:hypothetical protein
MGENTACLVDICSISDSISQSHRQDTSMFCGETCLLVKASDSVQLTENALKLFDEKSDMFVIEASISLQNLGSNSMAV